MAERNLPGLGLIAGFVDGDNDWGTSYNTNHIMLSALVNRQVLSRVTSLPVTPATGAIYIVPSADTEGNKVAVWDGDTGLEAWVYLDPAAGWHFYVTDEAKNYQFDGASWVEFAGSSGGATASPYDVQTGFTDTPTASQTIDIIPFVRAVDFPANLAGSIGTVVTTPAAVFVMSVQKNGTEFATITVSTSGVFTFAGTATSMASGDILTVVSPAVADVLVESLSVTLLGSA